MNTKQLLKELLPPRALRAARIHSPVRKPEPSYFTGDFGSWEEAEEASTKYGAPEILAKTRAAMLKVRNGEAVFERDSVVFDRPEYSFPLLAGLLRATR